MTSLPSGDILSADPALRGRCGAGLARMAAREGAAAERLARALDGSGAFRRFKDEVARMGLSQDWYSFRDDARANLARGFLEAHGVRWK